MDLDPVRRRQRKVLAMDPQDGLDRAFVDVPVTRTEPRGDPVRLGPPLEVGEIFLATTTVRRYDRHETPARHEPNEEQPPLEFRHQAGRIGARRVRGRGQVSRYTRPR